MLLQLEQLYLLIGLFQNHRICYANFRCHLHATGGQGCSIYQSKNIVAICFSSLWTKMLDNIQHYKAVGNQNVHVGLKLERLCRAGPSGSGRGALFWVCWCAPFLINCCYETKTKGVPIVVCPTSSASTWPCSAQPLDCVYTEERGGFCLTSV